MDNQPEKEINTTVDAINSNEIELLRYKTFARLMLFLFIGTAALLIFFILFSGRRNASLEKDYKSQLKEISVRVDSLRKQRVFLDSSASYILSGLNKLNIEKEKIYARIEGYKNELITIKQTYEKINTYTGISNDSLRSIFSKRFGNLHMFDRQ